MVMFMLRTNIPHDAHPEHDNVLRTWSHYATPYARPEIEEVEATPPHPWIIKERKRPSSVIQRDRTAVAVQTRDWRRSFSKNRLVVMMLSRRKVGAGVRRSGG